MRRVVLESPYAGDTVRNVEYALRCVSHALALGEAPFAGHLLYPRVLDDTVGEERERGIGAHLAWIEVADAVVVYRDRGCSGGMQQGIDAARALRKRVVHRWLDLGMEVDEATMIPVSMGTILDTIALYDRSVAVLRTQ